MVFSLVVENGVQAKHEIEALESKGYHRDHMYLFAHSTKRGKDLSKELDTELAPSDFDQIFFGGMKNLATSREQDLREQMKEIGLSDKDAVLLEKNLDSGQLVILVEEKK